MRWTRTPARLSSGSSARPGGAPATGRSRSRWTRTASAAPGGGRWTARTITRIAGNPVYLARGLVTRAESVRAAGRLSDTPAAQRAAQDAAVPLLAGDRVRSVRRPGPRRERPAAPTGTPAYSATPASPPPPRMSSSTAPRSSIWPPARPSWSPALTTRPLPGTAPRRRGTGRRSGRRRTPTTGTRSASASWRRSGPTGCRRREAADKRARHAEVPSALSGLPDADRAIVARRWDALTLPARKAAIRVLMPDLELRPGRGLPVHERIICWPHHG